MGRYPKPVKGGWMVRYSYEGRMLTIPELAERSAGISPQTLRKRIQVLGWSVVRAMTTPVRSHSRQE